MLKQFQCEKNKTKKQKFYPAYLARCSFKTVSWLKKMVKKIRKNIKNQKTE